MKKVTNNSKLKPANTIGSFLAAGLLIFGAVSCGQERGGTQEEGLATEQEYEEGYGVDGTRTNEPVRNTAAEDFGRYDRNTDQQWDKDEFNTRMTETGAFNEWDTDRDGNLNENEYNEGMRNWQNQSANNQGTTGTTGTTNTTGTTGTTTDNNLGTFNDWDTNRDGSIDQNEFNQGNFNAWDTDRNGTLSNDEYNRGMATQTPTNTGSDMGTGTGTDAGGTGSGTTGTDDGNRQ